MTIGLCAGIALDDPAGTSRHGAVFLLRNKSIVNAEVTLLDGWTTTVAAGTNVVVTRGPSSSTSFDETHTEALRAANNGLDYMCMRGWGSAAIRIDSDDCLVWWPDPVVGITLRARVIHTTRAKLSFTATVTDKDGNVVYDPPALPPTPAQHDALRFIRMSRTSEYLFAGSPSMRPGGFLDRRCTTCRTGMACVARDRLISHQYRSARTVMGITRVAAGVLDYAGGPW